MEQKHLDYASNQITYIFSQPRYVIFILLLAICGTAGALIAISIGSELPFHIGLVIVFGGALCLALHVHRLAGSPTTEDLMDSDKEG